MLISLQRLCLARRAAGVRLLAARAFSSAPGLEYAVEEAEHPDSRDGAETSGTQQPADQAPGAARGGHESPPAASDARPPRGTSRMLRWLSNPTRDELGPERSNELEFLMHTALEKQRDPGLARSTFEAYLEKYDALRAAKGGGDTAVTHLAPTRPCWDLYLMALHKACAPPDALLRTLRRMQQGYGVTPSASSYAPLFQRCSLAHSLPAAFMAIDALSEMQAHGAPPTVRSFVLALGAVRSAGRAAAIPLAHAALRLLRHARLPLSRDADFTALRHALIGVILMCLNTGQLGDGMAFLAALREHGMLVPSVVLQDLLVAAVGAGNPSALRILLATHRELQAGTTPDAAADLDEGTAVGILETAATAGDLPLALDAWRALEGALARRPAPARRVHHDWLGEAYAGSSAASVPSQRPPGAHFPDALLLADSPQAPDPLREPFSEAGGPATAPSYPPCVPAFHALIDTYVKAGDLRGAFRAIGALERAHPGDAKAVAFEAGLSCVVDAAAASPKAADAAYYVLEDMHAKGEPVSAAMADCVVAGCAAQGDVGRAFETFEAYSALGTRPGTQAYNAALTACLRARLLDSMPKILDEMAQEGVPWNAHTHALVVQKALIERQPRTGLDGVRAALAAGALVSANLWEHLVATSERWGDPNLTAAILALQLEANAPIEDRNCRTLAAVHKQKRWLPIGGMAALSGSRSFRLRPFRP